MSSNRNERDSTITYGRGVTAPGDEKFRGAISFCLGHDCIGGNDLDVPKHIRFVRSSGHYVRRCLYIVQSIRRVCDP
jgi:hypothetical protein